MANGRALKILLLFDVSQPIPPAEFAEYLKTEDWENEADILRTLKKLGHEAKPFALHDEIKPLFEEVQGNRPDLVFNLCEAFGGDRHFEPHVASMLELLKVPYTGAGATALRVCKDKALTKKILSYHRIHLPRFVVARRSHPLRSLKKFSFPAFIKPLGLEASEGIAQLSFADTEKDALERVRYVNERLGADAIVEEYIEGRELYVSILGNKKLQVFPPRELFFRQVPEGEPKFATFRAKWDDAYRKKWGINSGPANAIAPEVEKRMIESCRKIYNVLQLQGYGRIDLRLKENGEVYFIEANPNPSISRGDDFARSAEKGGMDYEALVAKIIKLAGV